MKKVITLFFPALLFFLITFLAAAGEINLNNGKTGVTFPGFSYQQLMLKSTVASLQFREVETPSGTFTELFIPGYSFSNTVGEPRLPVFRKLIEVPVGSTFDIVIHQSKFTDIDLGNYGVTHPVIPAQAPLAKNITDPPFVYNQLIYQQNDFLGLPIVAAEPVGTMRSVRMARLTVAPVRYNPVTNTLRIYEEITATLSFPGADITATINLRKELASPWFEKAFSLLPNYTPLTDELITTGPQTYVIVAPPNFATTLQPFIHWKTRKGFRIIEAYTDNPAVGNTTTSIKAYLEGLYNSPPAGYEAPSFILFAGDVGQVPAWTTGGHPSDLRYCEYTNDNIPEVYYGRFPAQTTVHLQAMIDKTVEYEKYTFPSPLFLNEVVMIAGADASHQMTWGNGQINYGTTYYFNTAHNILSHTYLQPEPPGANYSLQIRTNVSDGVSYANYTAHGSEQGWSDPAFEIQHIAALQNAHKYCLMVGNCCKTSNFSANCFAEEVLRAANKAALGYIGCSDYSYWDEDFWWGCGFKAISANPVYDPQHLGAYDVTFHDMGIGIEDWYVTQGQMFVGGNMAVEESSTSMKQYYWETYCLMGDPSLMIYFSVPPVLTATYENPVLVGTCTLEVNTEPYAYVALSLNDSTLLDAQCADSGGLASLVFDTVNNPCYLQLVITKQNRKPLIDSIQVIPATGPYLVYASCAVNDSVGGNNNHLADFSESITLDMTVNNIGIMTANAISATLVTTDTNVVVTDNTCVFDSVPPGGNATCTDAFAMNVGDFVQDQHRVACTLNMTNGTDVWTSRFNFVLNAPVLAVGNISVIDPAPGGNNNGILDPGETAQIRIVTNNQGHALSNNTSASITVLPGSAPWVMVTNPNCYLGNLPAGGFNHVYYDVVVNGITPVGTVVTFHYLVTGGQLSQYSVQKEIQLTIGLVPQILMSNNPVTTCFADYYDAGGPNNNYGNNENFTMTFYPGTTGAKVMAVFEEFSLEPEQNCNYDNLKVYNGSSTASPLLGTWCGTSIPDTIKSTASSGALTFQFHSDYNETYPGWIATVQCYGGPLTLLANAFPPFVCEGGSSQLVAVPSGGNGNYTYLWEPATYLDDPTSRTPVSTPLENITYTVTVNDGTGSLTSNPIPIEVRAVPEAPVITETGEYLESSSASGNQWYFNGYMIPGATGQSYTPHASGPYYCTVTDPSTGCASAPSNTIYFVVASAGEEPAAPHTVLVYPNPFSRTLTVEYTLPGNGPVKISLCDISGKEVVILLDRQTEAPGRHTHTFTMQPLPPGFWFCRVITSSYTVTKKVISNQ